jgi:uncharacterized membrane protein YheB (UPF0754 family)
MPWITINWHFNTLLASPNAVFWNILVPPILFAIHGFGATWMAVWCLFHPYSAKFIPGTKIQIPLTPGIFPKRRSKLSQAVAGTVTETLLTTADIRAKVETLLTESNIYLAVDLFIESVLVEFRDITKLHKLASDVAELSPTLLHHLLASTIDSIETGKDHRLATMIKKIFDEMILPAKITSEQAIAISNFLMDTVITPSKIRNALLILLSPQNISALDDAIQSHAGTAYKILARLIGVKRICYECRNFLEKEDEESQRILSELIKRFGLQEQITFQIASFDLRSLPLQTVARCRENLVVFIESFLLTYKNELLETVSKVQTEAMSTVRAAIIQFNPASLSPTWINRIKQDLANFSYMYLKRELGVLLEKAIPALGMYSLIAQKIDLFTAEQIEDVVKRICAQELLWLEIFGGIIGFFLGILQILVNAVS